MTTGIRWEDLFKRGVLVLLHVSMWRALIRVSTDDLGLDAEEKKSVEKAMNLGSHKLVPSGALGELTANEYECKAIIAKRGIEFEAFDSCHYVSADRVEQLKAELTAKVAERRECVERFIAAYPSYREAMVPKLAEALAAVCKSPQAAERALERILTAYPSVEELRRSFNMRFSFITIASPGEGIAAEGTAEITDAVRGMVGSLRKDLTDRLSKVIELSKAGGKLHGKSINAMREALDRATDLNRIIEDSTLATQIYVLAKLLDSAASGVDAARLTPDFEAAEVALTADLQSATDNALSALTSVGKRAIG